MEGKKNHALSKLKKKFWKSHFSLNKVLLKKLEVKYGVKDIVKPWEML